MKEYEAFFANYFNFSDRTDRRGYWTVVLINFGINFAFGILGKAGIGFFSIVTSLYGIATLIPGIAITVRRLRDAGKGWPWIFIVFVPVVGWIWLIILLAQRSIPYDGTPVV